MRPTDVMFLAFFLMSILIVSIHNGAALKRIERLLNPKDKDKP